MIKLLVWNCCGIASKGVAYVVKDMKDRYKLDVLVILEPRISGVHASKVIKCWGYRKSIKMEADGFAGGIWILWERDDLNVDLLIKEDQFVHCKLRLGIDEMLFMVVYASPTEQRRAGLWDALLGLAENIRGP